MMKIIFGEQFENDLKNPEYILNICSFGIHTFEAGKSLSRKTILSNLPNEIDNKDFKFQGIWEEDKKKLMLSFDYSLDSFLTTDSSSPAIYCFYTEKYDNSRSKIAFVLVQADDENSNQFGQNKLSINKNLINIDFSGLDIEAKLITAQSENISFLEKDNINLGCSIFLANKRGLTQEEREETIVTKESYRRYLLRSKCKENPIGDFNLGRDFLTTNDGEKIYRNTTYRVYSPNLFIPNLSGDLVIVESEKITTTERPTLAPPNYKDDEIIDADLGETTSSTSTTTDIPTLDNNSSSTSSKKPDSIVVKPDVDDSDLGNTSSTQINSSAIPVVRSRAAIEEEHPNTTLPDEGTSTTSKPGNNDNQGPEIIYEYNTFGIGCSSGKIDITGIVGYTDYSIKNNISKIKRTGYQDISDLPNIIVEKEKVRKPNSLEYYDEIWADDVKVIGKSIEYPEMTDGNDVRCNYINISIQSVDHTGKLITCKKQFKIKQSNDYDNPWVQLDGSDWEGSKIEDVCYYSVELENSGTGLIKNKIPVIVFYEDAENIDYTTQLDPYTITTWDKDTINAIETVGLEYEYSYLKGYESSEDPRDMFFKFFDFKEISTSDLKENRNRYLIIGKEPNTGKEISWSLRFGLKPKKLNEIFNEDLEGRFDRWHPYDDPKDEGIFNDNKQLIIKTTVRLSLPRGYEVLHGTNKFETSFIVIKEPKKKKLGLYKGRYGYDDYEKIKDTIILSKQYDSFFSTGPLQLLTDDNSKLEFTDSVVNGWAIINNNGIALSSKDYGVMSRPSEYNKDTPEFEYSDPIMISSEITEDYKFDPIKFIYLDGHIFGTGNTTDKDIAVREMIDSIEDISSWKTLALCPKVELKVEKDKSIKVLHNDEERVFSLTDSNYNPVIESNRFDVTVQDPNFELFTIEATDPFTVRFRNIKQELTFLDENGEAVQDGTTYSEGSYKFYAKVSNIITNLGAGTYGELILQSYKDRLIIVGVKNSDYTLQRETDYYPQGTSQLNEYNTLLIDNSEETFKGYYQIITSNLPVGKVKTIEGDADYGINLVGEDSNVFLDSRLISEVVNDTLCYKSTEIRVEGSTNNTSYPKYPLINPSKLIQLGNSEKYLYIFNGTSPKFYDSFGNYSKDISVNIITRTNEISETTLFFLSEYPIYLNNEQNNNGIICEISSNGPEIKQIPTYSLATATELDDNFNLTKTITDRLAYSIDDYSSGNIIPYKFILGEGSVSVDIPSYAQDMVWDLGRLTIKQSITKLSGDLEISEQLYPSDQFNINIRLFVHPVISLIINGLEYKPNGLNTTTTKDPDDNTVYNTEITYPEVSYLGEQLSLCIEKPHNNCLNTVPSNVVLSNGLSNNPKRTLNKSSIFGSLEISKIPEIEDNLSKLPEPLNYSEFDSDILSSLSTAQTERLWCLCILRASVYSQSGIQSQCVS